MIRKDTGASILDLDDELTQDPATVGVKAAVLAKLRADGEAVPPGFVALPGADATEVARLAVGRFKGLPVAVRSSSLSEDLASASFAGQYHTELDVAGVEAVASAVRTVRGSAGDAVERGYSEVEASMPILIMPMLEPEAAGVAFSRNPVTGDDAVIVEAVPGLGEALVSGLSSPQRFICRPGDVPQRQEGEGSEVISPDQVAEIASLARRLAERLGSPQDVEWAVEGGRLHILQSRPITALPIEPVIEFPGHRETWIRADENYTSPVRPLEFSVWAPRLEASAMAVFAEIGAPIETMRYKSIGGWVYSRLVPPLDQAKDDQPSPPAWLFGLLTRVVPSFRRKLRTAALVWRSDFGGQVADEWETGGRSRMRARARELRTVDRRLLDDEGLARHFENVLNHLQEASDVHMRLPAVATFLPTGHLGVLCERLLGWSPEQTLRLVQGYTSVTDVADDVGVLVDAVANDEAAVRLLHENPVGMLDLGGEAGEMLRSHLDRHGHQMVGMDLAHPTWAEDPRPFLAIVRTRMDRPDTIRTDRQSVAAVDELQARRLLADRPKDLAEFERALAAARRGIGYGDDTEFDVLGAFALVRYVALEAGYRLSERGILARPDDIFFVREDELLGLLRGGPLDVDIERRRGEYLWAKGHRGPKRYGPEPVSPPSMRWTPKAARPFLEAMIWAIDKMAGAPVNDTGSYGVLAGTAASPGRATGTVRVIRDPSEFPLVQPDDVLVCPSTVAAWSVVFPLVSAIVTEVGGPLSHPGILSREFGIPAVLGVEDATIKLQTGQLVTVDGTTGRVKVERDSRGSNFDV